MLSRLSSLFGYSTSCRCLMASQIVFVKTPACKSSLAEWSKVLCECQADFLLIASQPYVELMLHLAIVGERFNEPTHAEFGGIPSHATMAL